MSREASQNGPVHAIFLPQFPQADKLQRMISVLNNRYISKGAAAVVLAAAFAVPVSAQMREDLAQAAEFPAETAAIVAATSALFDAVEARPDTPRRRPVLGAPMIATPASLDQPDDKAEVLKAKGEVDHLTGYRITWYPVDRFLGSVDFMGTWDGNRNLVCGYVIWDLSDPDVPVLDDIEATFVDVGELSGSSDEEIHTALLEANCAYGAVDANYAFFE